MASIYFFDFVFKSRLLVINLNLPILLVNCLLQIICMKYWTKIAQRWAVVLNQLVEWSLPKPEVRSSNPVNAVKILIEHLFIINCQLH